MFGIIISVVALIVVVALVHYALIGRKDHALYIAQNDVLAFRSQHSRSRGRHSSARAARHARARRILAAHAA